MFNYAENDCEEEEFDTSRPRSQTQNWFNSHSGKQHAIDFSYLFNFNPFGNDNSSDEMHYPPMHDPWKQTIFSQSSTTYNYPSKSSKGGGIDHVNTNVANTVYMSGSVIFIKASKAQDLAPTKKEVLSHGA